MSNVYNASPIFIDTVMASGWKALQTLNTGALPGYTTTTGTRQPGIRVYQVVWTGLAAGTDNFTIVDPNDSTLVLLQGKAASTLGDQLYEFPVPKDWRDFKVSALSAGKLLIFYRI